MRRRYRTLLGVWAHPDDEAYMSAGLMASFRRRGDRVVVISATLGEHGTNEMTTHPPETLRGIRHDELLDSLAVLGVHEVHVLGYPDGFCALDDGTAVVARYIDEIEPDLIVTFGPDGMTGHPDHRAVSSWATRARSIARSSADLWYATLTADFHRRWGAVNDEIGFFADQPEPPCTERSDLTHSACLPDDLLDLKVAALRAHASQTRPMVERLGATAYREWWRTESFRRPTVDELSERWRDAARRASRSM